MVSGFAAATPLSGLWQTEPNRALQTDGASLSAKLEIPVAQSRAAHRYSFSARSTGTGLVGLGLHAFVESSVKPEEFWAGTSVLVWLTRDPKHFGDNQARLQVYRSLSDTAMRLVKEVIVAESPDELNRFTVDLDPITGSLSVALNDVQRLSCGGLSYLKQGTSVVLRALDKAEFRDFRVELLP